MASRSFDCRSCGKSFSLKEETLSRYPGWTPSICLACRDKTKSSKGAPKRRSARSPAGDRVAAACPSSGVFTDGACSGNPGPGGWGVVQVRDDAVVAERSGSAARTTNNRMELTAIIEAFRLLDAESEETIYSDSQLVVRTLNEWAEGWEKRGWRRKSGPVENLDLVREAYELSRAHPRVRIAWLKGHAGLRWNEHADRLATAALP